MTIEKKEDKKTEQLHEIILNEKQKANILSLNQGVQIANQRMNDYLQAILDTSGVDGKKYGLTKDLKLIETK